MVFQTRKPKTDSAKARKLTAMNRKLHSFFAPGRNWHEEFTTLRETILECGLQEEMKWGQACYTLDGKNIVLIHGFKDYCALLFFKGVLLTDRKKLLIQQTPNVQVARQIRFTEVRQILSLRATLKSYVREAMKLERSGKKAGIKKATELPMPDEFREKLDKLPALRKAFNKLTPGRQRGYLLYFSSAKQAKTRASRVAKSISPIMNGKGLDD